MLTLSTFVELLAGQTLEARFVVRDVVDSLDAVRRDALFAASAESDVDGHASLEQAFAAGAIAALVERDVPAGEATVLDLRQPLDESALAEAQPPVVLRVDHTRLALMEVAAAWRNRFKDLRVIGVTGSVGKTMTKELAYAVLSERYRTYRSEDNVNNALGLALSVLRITEKHERVVLEMGLHNGGNIASLAHMTRPAVGIVTTIEPIHLDQTGSLERLIDAKSQLLENLPPGPAGVAILNMDEDLVMQMRGRTEADIFTYGLNPNADLWASELEGMGLDGMRFWLHHAGQAMQVRVPMLGRHAVHTALRAAAVGLVEGLSWRDVLMGLQSSVAELRLVAVRGPRDSIMLDDTYDASPESVIAALNLLRELEGRRIAVLGDMRGLGNFENQGHEMVGIRARQVVDELVTVGELGEKIAHAALNDGLAANQVHILPGIEEAVAYLRGGIQAGDVLLVKGSSSLGMGRIVAELEQVHA